MSATHRDGGNPTSPQAIAKTLSPTMKAHVQYGIAGAPQSTLDALERRGLVQDAAGSGYVGFVELSPLGECVRVVLRRTDAAQQVCALPSPLWAYLPGMWVVSTLAPDHPCHHVPGRVVCAAEHAPTGVTASAQVLYEASGPLLRELIEQ